MGCTLYPGSPVLHCADDDGDAADDGDATNYCLGNEGAVRARALDNLLTPSWAERRIRANNTGSTSDRPRLQGHKRTVLAWALNWSLTSRQWVGHGP